MGRTGNVVPLTVAAGVRLRFYATNRAPAAPRRKTLLLSSVEKDRSGIASGVLNTVRQAGGALGVAVLGSLLAAHAVAGVRAAFVISAALLLITTIAALGCRRTANAGRNAANPKLPSAQ